MRQEIIITREELYQQVWSKPIIHLAKEFGLSDNGLLKVCKKLNIPSPERGYWRKIEVGQKVKKKALPPIKENGISEYKFYKETDMIDESKITLSNEAEIKIQKLKDANNKIIVSDSIDNPHPLVKMTMKVLKPSSKNNRFVTSESGNKLDIHVSSTLLNRAFLIMDALIKALEEYDFYIRIQDGKTTVKVFDEDVQFALEEKAKRIELPKKQPYSFTEYEYVPTGVIILRITNLEYTHEPMRRNFNDHKSKKVEDQLNDFIKALIHGAFTYKETRRRNEEWRRNYEEQERIRKEKIRLAELEKERIIDLNGTLECWQKSKNVRELIKEYKNKIAAQEYSSEEILEIGEWISWAQDYADKIDPLKKKKGLMK